MIVCKFGGSSMRNSRTIRLVSDIIEANTHRKFIVVSAPGVGDEYNYKVTDMLYRCFDSKGNERVKLFNTVVGRFCILANELIPDEDISFIIDNYRQALDTTERVDDIVAMGEHLTAYILSKYIGYDFIDSRDIVCFDRIGCVDIEQSIKKSREKLKSHANAVIPGFYGLDSYGRTTLFTRGGSDVTGALIARAVGADTYENWTDVSGYFTVDPTIIDDPLKIERLSFDELRRLSIWSSSVLHRDTVLPLIGSDTVINIRNTFATDDSGTFIYSSVNNGQNIIGIGGKRGLKLLSIEKENIKDDYSISTFRDIDYISCVADRLDMICRDVPLCLTDTNSIAYGDIAVISLVIRDVNKAMDLSIRAFSLLLDKQIEIKTIFRGVNDSDLLIAVNDSDYIDAVRVLYRGLIDDIRKHGRN